MTILASASSKGFYDADIHGNNVPSDAVEITAEYHMSLLNAQSSGKVIDWSGDIPVAVDPPALTFEQEVALFKISIQARLDAAAVAAGYDEIKTAVSYADEPSVPKFQAEGLAFRAWRSKVWAYAYEQLDKVAKGDRAKPTVDELLAELPALELPA